LRMPVASGYLMVSLFNHCRCGTPFCSTQSRRIYRRSPVPRQAQARLTSLHLKTVKHPGAAPFDCIWFDCGILA
jgi:hypothetical protein